MRTKKCKFQLPEPTKSNTLNLFIAKKYQNENAVHSRPARAAILSQIGGEFSRFSVALVDLSEPDPYEDPHEARPGNRIDFKQNRGSWDVHAPEPDRSRPDIGKNLLSTCISSITSRRTTEPKPGNHRIFTEIIEIHRIRTSYESGSDRSSRNRLNTHAHVFCKSLPCSFCISLRNNEKSSTKTTKVYTPVTFEPPT